MPRLAMLLMLSSVFWAAQGSRARVPDGPASRASYEDKLNTQSVSKSIGGSKSSAPLQDSLSTGLLEVSTGSPHHLLVPHRRRRWSHARVAKWSIPAFVAATYMGGYLPASGVGNITAQGPSNGNVGGAVPTYGHSRLWTGFSQIVDPETNEIPIFPSDGTAKNSPRSRVWAGRPAHTNNDITPASQVSLGNAVDVVESNLPKILSHDPDWNIFKDYSLFSSLPETTDGDLFVPAPPMQSEKRNVLKAVASLPDVFNKRAKTAIGVWSVFGQSGALRGLRDLAEKGPPTIPDQKDLAEAREIVHGFGNSVVKMAAATMLFPHMATSIFDLIKTSKQPVAEVKDKLMDWSQRLGNVVAKKVGVADFLGGDMLKWARLPLPTQYAGIVAGMYFAPATKKLRGLLAKNPRLVLSVLKEDALKPGKALRRVGNAGKTFMQKLKRQQKRLKDETGVIDLVALSM